MATHVVRVDKDMGVHVDKPGRNKSAFGADRPPRLVCWQRGGDRDDFAAGNANIHHPAQSSTRVEYITTGQQKVIFHRFLHLAFAGSFIVTGVLTSCRRAPVLTPAMAL
jgi:hypothetical protein